MIYRKIVRKVGLILFVIAACSFPYIFIQDQNKHDIVKHTVTAQGIIEDKRAVQYRCGSKGNSTCTEYILSINDKDHVVNTNTFYRNPIGKNITLTVKEEQEGSTKYELILLIATFIPFIIMMFIIFILFVVFGVWCFFSDTEKSFIHYLKDEGFI